MIAAAADVHILSPAIVGKAAVRREVGLEEFAALYPRDELFVLWFRQDLANPFAVIMRIPKERIAKAGWPLIVDPETRVVAFNSPERD